MSTNRTAQIAKVHKVLKKHYKPVAPPAERTVLEHLLYACLLENARFEAADEAFARLRELYFDWNEIRVTTVTELAEGMTSLADATAAAQRVKKSLQSVFEGAGHYQYDLEGLRKQNLGKSEKDLEKVQGSTPFVRAYVAQNALAGHNIPVSKGTIDVLHGVGVISDSEADKGEVPGLERAIPKTKGVEFFSLLHQLGVDFAASPGSSKLRAILAEVDGDFKERIAKRQARLEAQAAQNAAAAKVARDKARAEARAAAEVKPPAKPSKDAGKGKGKDAAKPRTAPPAGKKDAAGGAPSPAKGLAKKKPR